MSYNNLLVRWRVERIAVNVFAAGLVLAAVIHGAKAAEDWSILNNDRGAAQYYDSQPDTTPEIVAEEHEVLVADEARLQSDGTLALLEFGGAVALGLGGNYVLSVFERRRSETSPTNEITDQE